jgi:adenosine deaminase
MDLASFVLGLPKAELHLHLEGTLEPAMLFALAERNRIPLAAGSPEELAAAYDFADLQAFLDLYYLGCRVLIEPQDFYDLAAAYFARCRAENILHAEVFFDPQTHTARDVPIQHVFDGFLGAAQDAERQFGLSIGFIMCFLRHLDAAEGFKLLDEAAPYLDRLIAVGLDSSERDHPPAKYAGVFAEARRRGLRAVAHAGEEGPAAYIWDALRYLGVARIDHGVRAMEDQALVGRLVREQVPLTVCPLSNVRLRVVEDLAHHPLRRMLDKGLMVTVNSDDPAYFGGYVNENYRASAQALGLGRDEIAALVRNGIKASLMTTAEKDKALADVDRVLAETM